MWFYISGAICMEVLCWRNNDFSNVQICSCTSVNYRLLWSFQYIVHKTLPGNCNLTCRLFILSRLNSINTNSSTRNTFHKYFFVWTSVLHWILFYVLNWLNMAFKDLPFKFSRIGKNHQGPHLVNKMVDQWYLLRFWS